jgi:hypothetical protein
VFCVIIYCLSVKVYDKVRVLMFNLNFKCCNAMCYNNDYYMLHIPLHSYMCVCV